MLETANWGARDINLSKVLYFFLRNLHSTLVIKSINSSTKIFSVIRYIEKKIYPNSMELTN